jgi:hypothetical protein
MENELRELIEALEGKDKILTEQTRLLYKLNNHFYPELKEHNMGCSACRERIYKRMKSHWEMIKNK